MNKERLLRLADVILPKVPKANFDMSYWECGTTACAIGWACQDPVFNAEGFKFTEGYGDAWKVPVFQAEPDTFKRWFAIQRFFDLNLVDAEYLFSGTKYRGEGYSGIHDIPSKAVSKRIHELIKRDDRTEELLKKLRATA